MTNTNDKNSSLGQICHSEVTIGRMKEDEVTTTTAPPPLLLDFASELSSVMFTAKPFLFPWLPQHEFHSPFLLWV